MNEKNEDHKIREETYLVVSKFFSIPRVFNNSANPVMSSELYRKYRKPKEKLYLMLLLFVG